MISRVSLLVGLIAAGMALSVVGCAREDTAAGGGSTPDPKSTVRDQSDGDRISLNFDLPHAPGRLLVAFEGEPFLGGLGDEWILPASAKAQRHPERENALSWMEFGVTLVVHNRGAEARSGRDFASDARALAATFDDPLTDGLKALSLDYEAVLHTNDTDFELQWGLDNPGDLPGALKDKDVDGPEAWALSGFNAPVTVGVIDTGVDKDHEDLHSRVVAGWSSFSGEDGTKDEVGHGTLVAGIIAAIEQNQRGISGLGRNVEIMPFKVFNKTENPSHSEIKDAYVEAAAKNVKIINASWGFPDSKPEFLAFVCNGAGADILTVASAGNSKVNMDVPNSGKLRRSYPASLVFEEPTECADNILVVTATDHADELAGSANWGESTVQLGAPGWRILSTMSCFPPIPYDETSTPPKPGCTRYRYLNGTSAAAPHVAATAALILSKLPGSTPSQIKTRILDNADESDHLLGRVASKRRLNAHCAVKGC